MNYHEKIFILIVLLVLISVAYILNYYTPIVEAIFAIIIPAVLINIAVLKLIEKTLGLFSAISLFNEYRDLFFIPEVPLQALIYYLF